MSPPRLGIARPTVHSPLRLGFTGTVLPHRGRWGDARPDGLADAALPPHPVPAWSGGRPRHRWRYLGVYAEELMLGVADVAIAGVLRQTFWSMWDVPTDRLLGRTSAWRHSVTRDGSRMLVHDGSVAIDVVVDEAAGVETISRSGTQLAWTRKQAAIPAHVRLTLDGSTRELDALACVDDSDGHHARHVAWRWSTGVGRLVGGAVVGWNLVAGIHDDPAASERTVWVDGEPHPVGPAVFADDLTAVTIDGLVLRAALGPVRVANDNRLLVRSRYRQPYARFSGSLPGAGELAAGWGVMEEHDVHW